MYTSLVERTLFAGRHTNLSSGVASARAINCSETCFHSPSYPCHSPSGYFCPTEKVALTRSNTKQNPIHLRPTAHLNLSFQNPLTAPRIIDHPVWEVTI